MPKTFSGKQVIKILCRDFGFYFVSQKGSHVKLNKKLRNKEIITIVPDLLFIPPKADEPAGWRETTNLFLKLAV